MTSHLSKVTIAGGITLAVVLIAASAAFYTIFVKAPTDLARNTAAGIKELFHVTPQVKINQTIVIEQSTPILEIATIARGVFVDHTWSHTWMGSMKTLELRGSFTAKAGFNLRDPFAVTIERRPLAVTAILPAPKILSLQMDSYQVVQDESGWWNRISNADREAAVNELYAVARQQAETSGILDEARTTAESRIREIVERNGATIVFNKTRNGGDLPPGP